MGYMHSWSMVNRTMDEPGFSWFMGPVIGLILVALWLWLLVDCARRDFRNNVEKALWVLVLMLAPLVGAVAYLVVIKYNNPAGLLNPDWRGPSPKAVQRMVPPEPSSTTPTDSTENKG